MTPPENRVPIKGSERKPLSGARILQATRPDERIEVMVKVRPRAPLANLDSSPALTSKLPKQRKYLSREEFEKSYGANPDDLDKITAFAKSHNLIVVDSSGARRSVLLSGTVGDFNTAFGVILKDFEYSNGTYRGRTGAVTVPAELSEVVVGVHGLDNRVQFKPHFQIKRPVGFAGPHIGEVSFTPLELARIYNFPKNLDGNGQCIAIIELGGGLPHCGRIEIFR
jgi:kumamolisin